MLLDEELSEEEDALLPAKVSPPSSKRQPFVIHGLSPLNQVQQLHPPLLDDSKPKAGTHLAMSQTNRHRLLAELDRAIASATASNHSMSAVNEPSNEAGNEEEAVERELADVFQSLSKDKQDQQKTAEDVREEMDALLASIGPLQPAAEAAPERQKQVPKTKESPPKKRPRAENADVRAKDVEKRFRVLNGKMLKNLDRLQAIADEQYRIGGFLFDQRRGTPEWQALQQEQTLLQKENIALRKRLDAVLKTRSSVYVPS